MSDGVRALVEIVGIELAYARAEIAMTTRIGDAKSRISNHLDAAMETLERLQLSVEERTIFNWSRRLSRKQVARIRSAKPRAKSRDQRPQAAAGMLNFIDMAAKFDPNGEGLACYGAAE